MPLTSRWSTWLICVLCFWMTDQMHDGKCNELLVREEIIHGRGPAKAVYIPNLLSSLRFLRLVIFFFALLLAVARAAVPQPPSLPNYHPHTDRQAADGETCCVHEEIQFSDETNVLHQGGCVVVLEEEEEVQVQTQSGTSSHSVWVCMVVTLSWAGCSHRVRSFIYSYIHLFILFPRYCPVILAADSKLAALHSLKQKHSKTTDTFEGKYFGWTQHLYKIMQHTVTTLPPLQQKLNKVESMYLWDWKLDRDSIYF